MRDFVVGFFVQNLWKQQKQSGRNGSISQMNAQPIVNFDLILSLQLGKAVDYFAGVRCTNETGDVNIDKGGHQVLTIETIHNATVAWNDITKVFDFEGSLEATGEETTERTNNGAEQRKGQRVQHEWINMDSGRECKLKREKKLKINIHFPVKKIQ